MRRPPFGQDISSGHPARWTAHASILVGLGAIVGVLARYEIGRWLQGVGGVFPMGTFVVNLAGCVVIGVVQYLFLDAGIVSRSGQLVLVAGFCASFTTFSTFGIETLRLLEGGYPLVALGYQLLSVGCGVLAVVCGRGIARLGVRMLGGNGRAA